MRVSITDEGQGIAPEFQPHVFYTFYQVDSSSTRDRGGPGLGLSISKAIVELLGGRIGLESVVGEGTTFWVDLPEYRKGADEDVAALDAV